MSLVALLTGGLKILKESKDKQVFYLKRACFVSFSAWFCVVTF